MSEHTKTIGEVNALRAVQLRVQDAERRERWYGNSDKRIIEEGIQVHWTVTRQRLGEIRASNAGRYTRKKCG